MGSAAQCTQAGWGHMPAQARQGIGRHGWKLPAWHMLRLCDQGVLTQRLEGMVLKVRTPVLWLQGAEHGGRAPSQRVAALRLTTA